MEVENVLAKNIAAAGDKAAYDAACKRLLANKVILAWIMKSCLEEYRDLEVNEIAEKYIEGDPSIGQTEVNPDEKTENCCFLPRKSQRKRKKYCRMILILR